MRERERESEREREREREGDVVNKFLKSQTSTPFGVRKRGKQLTNRHLDVAQLLVGTWMCDLL